MNKSATRDIDGSADDSPPKPRRATLISPRTEAFKTGRGPKRKETLDDPFDPRKYREIYSETD